MKLRTTIQRIICSLALAAVMLTSGCSTTRGYATAHQFYEKQNYVMAINLYDQYLKSAQNGALVTTAELERSECYFHLGMQAYNKENWLLANRLFYLANSAKADSYEDNSRFNIAQLAFARGDTTAVLAEYAHILSYMPDSELEPQILFHRIQIFLAQDEKEQAVADFTHLWQEYPADEFTAQARPLIDNIMPHYIAIAQQALDAGEYQSALDQLFVLQEYTLSHQAQIRTLISDTYEAMAQNALNAGDMLVARRSFNQAISFEPAKEERITNQIEAICRGYIQQGNEQASAYQVDDAIAMYQRCFQLIPNCTEATAAIEQADQLRKDIEDAMVLAAEAARLEDEKDYAKALTHYQASYRLIPLEDVKHKIFVMKNILRAEENPQDFAISVLEKYKKGKVVAAISDLERELRLTYSDELTSSGWRVLYAFGDFKYEVRYDLLTPAENYYFIWRVNLTDQTVIPLNKLTEEILETKRNSQ